MNSNLHQLHDAQERLTIKIGETHERIELLLAITSAMVDRMTAVSNRCPCMKTDSDFQSLLSKIQTLFPTKN